MFLDWENQYFQNDYTTQSNLQIQWNPYQITNGIFHITKTKKLHNLYGNKKKDPEYSKKSWEAKVELEEPISLTSNYGTYLQSSRQYGTGIKTEI